MQQPPLSSSGATSLPPRRSDAALSPAPSDDSDSDISLGTHSPVPSSMSMQHSPGSASGGGNDREERLQEEREKDFSRSFSALNSFRFDVHSPATMAGELPQIVYVSTCQISCDFFHRLPNWSRQVLIDTAIGI